MPLDDDDARQTVRPWADVRPCSLKNLLFDIHFFW